MLWLYDDTPERLDRVVDQVIPIAAWARCKYHGHVLYTELDGKQYCVWCLKRQD